MTTADWVVVGLAACFGIYVYARLIREFAPDFARWRRSTVRAAPRPDYAKIAVLEYELLGIEPKPGTVAAFAVGMQRVGRALNGERVAAVDFPAGIRRSEIDTWCANYEHLAANTITVPKPDGSVKLLYVDPHGRRYCSHNYGPWAPFPSDGRPKRRRYCMDCDGYQTEYTDRR